MRPEITSGLISNSKSKSRSSSRSTSSDDEAAAASNAFLDALMARFLAAPMRRDDRGPTAEIEVRVTRNEALQVLKSVESGNFARRTSNPALNRHVQRRLSLALFNCRRS